MTIIIECLLLAILFNVPMLLHALHRRRFAAAKLEISRVVTEMELLMLRGDDLKLGDICHDQIYQRMLKTQYATRFTVPWKFWQLPEDFAIIRKRIHHETSKKTPLGKLLIRHNYACFQAFRNNRPGASLVFMLWVLVFAGGTSVLLIGLRGFLLGLVGIVLAQNSAQKAWHNFKQKGWQNYKQLTSECYAACNSLQLAEARKRSASSPVACGA